MDSDDDEFLYGPSKNEQPQISVPQPQIAADPNGVVAQFEDEVFDLGELTPPPPETNGNQQEPEPAPETEDEAQPDEGDEEDESDDDIEIIMEPTARTLDLRQTRPTVNRSIGSTQAPPNQAPPQPAPSLTTEYTPIERGAPTKPPPAVPTPQQSTPVPQSQPLQRTVSQNENILEGPDPNSLPPTTAPPSHPQIDPTAVGILDGRSILEVDLSTLSDKPWRRPGSDISDWFNYGFDEISWEAYCYRRKEVGDVAGVLKTNVVNYAGMPEEQLAALPPEIRSMVMASATTYMTNGGPNPGMMPQNVGMPMMNDMGMNMPQMGMMNGMNGDMNSMGMGMQEGGAGIPGQIPQDSGEGFNGGMMGIMGGEYGMQDPNVMQQQMYQGMEGGNTPIQAPPPVRPTPVPFRGRGQGMGMRGRGGGFQRGRGGPPIPVRPASPLPPNVPTGPRNQNKYKDKDRDGNSGVDGLDYGGGRDVNSGTPPEERSRKRRGSPAMEDGRSKRR